MAGLLRGSEDPVDAETRREGFDKYLGAEKEHSRSVRESVKSAVDEHRPLPHQPDAGLVRKFAGKRLQDHEQSASGQPREQKFSNPDSEPAKRRQAVVDAFYEAKANANGRYSDESIRAQHRGETELRELLNRTPPQHRQHIGRTLQAVKEEIALKAQGRSSFTPEEWALINVQPNGHFSVSGAFAAAASWAKRQARARGDRMRPPQDRAAQIRQNLQQRGYR
jgi:hypothetical protein